MRWMAIPLLIVAFPAAAGTFDDKWLTRIKPPPYGGIATEFTDRRGAWGNRIDPHRQFVCAHLIEPRGQRLLVTNVANGRSAVCEVQDRGPDRHKRFWPRREIDITPPVNRAIGCGGYCRVTIERVKK